MQTGLCNEELLLDALMSEQLMTMLYNSAAGEAVSLAVRSEWVNILTEEHQIRHELILEMQKRGWVHSEPAQEAQIKQVQQTYPPR